MNRFLVFLRISLGIILFSTSFLPFEFFFGKFRDAQALAPATQRLYGCLTVVFLALLVEFGCPTKSRRLWGLITNYLERLPFPAVLFCGACILFSAELLISTFVFERKPLLVDGVVQLFQAKIFASGSLTAPVPNHPEFFVTQNMLFEDGKWFSQYPPGYPFLLSLGCLAGVAWVVSPLLSTITLIFLTLSVREAYGEGLARWMPIVLLLSPFFLFLGADFMNHATALTGLSVASYQVLRFYKGRGNVLSGVFFGLGLGLTFLTRPVCACSAALVFAAFSFPLPRNSFRSLCSMAISSVLVSSVYFLYNRYTTGEWFVPGYLKLWGSAHGMGFHESPWGYEFTFHKALGNQLFNLALLNEYLFEWIAPGLFPLSIFLMTKDKLSREDRFFLSLALIFPIAYFAYWHRDSYLGPRFLYSSLLGVLPLILRSIASVPELLSNYNLHLSNGTRRFSLREVFSVAVFFSLLSGVFLGFPSRIDWNRHSFSSMRLDIRELAERQGIRSGIVFVPISWGGRILSNLRAQGVSAGLLEKAYRKVDHCLLWELSVQARVDTLSLQELERQIVDLMKRNEELVSFDWNSDRTLKLMPERRLSGSCAEEIEYDRKGYSVFLPHLVANDPSLKSPFIVASDLRSQNRVILQEFPDLAPYILRNGELVPWQEEISAGEGA